MQELYQELIIDHGKRPRNYRRLAAPTCSHEGYNPLCGDRLNIYVEHDGTCITDVCFQGEGCAISMASASLLTQAVKGQSIVRAEEIFTLFHQALTLGKVDMTDDLGKLEALLGVAQYPTRVKCATLAWHTFKAALDCRKSRVSTE